MLRRSVLTIGVALWISAADAVQVYQGSLTVNWVTVQSIGRHAIIFNNTAGGPFTFPLGPAPCNNGGRGVVETTSDPADGTRLIMAVASMAQLTGRPVAVIYDSVTCVELTPGSGTYFPLITGIYLQQ